MNEPVRILSDLGKMDVKIGNVLFYFQCQLFLGKICFI